MSKVTFWSQYNNKSRFKRPLKQFGLKMSAKSLQVCTGRVTHRLGCAENFARESSWQLTKKLVPC